MSPALLGAALLAGLAVVVGLTPHRDRPGMRLRSGGSSGQARAGPGAAGAVSAGSSGWSPEGEPGPATRTRAAALLAAVAAWLLLGGLLGPVVAVGIAVGMPIAVARMEPAAVRKRRLELIGTAPLVADLLGASLLAGVPLEHAVPVVARALDGACSGALLGVHRRSELGESTAQAWAPLASAPGLGGIARAVARSSRTGAPLAGLLTAAADELRADATAAAMAQVRATSVRAVLPLGLCLLPAFALLGIAPIIAGLLPSL
ncbi:MAG: type II secretion system F family protein [Candidatus Nanopelagicales bacterium]